MYDSFLCGVRCVMAAIEAAKQYGIKVMYYD